mmetsp:Transcript_40714/g.88046  ORF Transcript_40714/g.88046 Transcript_40714/m.88046 type:complete len:301 (-) Transcript_40714:326-1228(-)
MLCIQHRVDHLEHVWDRLLVVGKRRLNLLRLLCSLLGDDLLDNLEDRDIVRLEDGVPFSVADADVSVEESRAESKRLLISLRSGRYLREARHNPPMNVDHRKRASQPQLTVGPVWGNGRDALVQCQRFNGVIHTLSGFWGDAGNDVGRESALLSLGDTELDMETRDWFLQSEGGEEKVVGLWVGGGERWHSRSGVEELDRSITPERDRVQRHLDLYGQCMARLLGHENKLGLDVEPGRYSDGLTRHFLELASVCVHVSSQFVNVLSQRSDLGISQGRHFSRRRCCILCFLALLSLGASVG